MNVEIGAEAALFPEKEYINGIAVAVRIYCTSVLGRVSEYNYEGCRFAPWEILFDSCIYVE